MALPGEGTASTKSSGGTKPGVSEEQAEGHSRSTEGGERVHQMLGKKGWDQNIQDFRTSYILISQVQNYY